MSARHHLARARRKPSQGVGWSGGARLREAPSSTASQGQGPMGGPLPACPGSVTPSLLPHSRPPSPALPRLAWPPGADAAPAAGPPPGAGRRGAGAGRRLRLTRAVALVGPAAHRGPARAGVFAAVFAPNDSGHPPSHEPFRPDKCAASKLCQNCSSPDNMGESYHSPEKKRLVKNLPCVGGGWQPAIWTGSRGHHHLP